MEDKRMNLYEATEFYNIREIIKNSVKKYPTNIAFIMKEKNDDKVNYKKITYKEFDEQINSLGTAFMDMGLKDKRIAIIGKNRYEWMITYFAAVNGTGVVVPLDKGLPEQEIEDSLVRSKADAIVFEESYIKIIKGIKERGKTQVKEFICMDEQ